MSRCYNILSILHSISVTYSREISTVLKVQLHLRHHKGLCNDNDNPNEIALFHTQGVLRNEPQ